MLNFGGGVLSKVKRDPGEGIFPVLCMSAFKKKFCQFFGYLLTSLEKVHAYTTKVKKSVRTSRMGVYNQKQKLT